MQTGNESEVAQVQEGSIQRPAWAGPRTAWSLLFCSLLCLTTFVLFVNSLSDAALAVLIGLMMGLGIVAAAVAFVWLRWVRNLEKPNAQSLGAGAVILSGLALFATPLLIFAWVVFFFEGQ